jgi:phosphoglycolate phosphatase
VRPSLWLFDLDGTLIDSAPGIHASIDHARCALGLAPLPDAELAQWIGPPLRESFARVLPDAAAVENAVALYRAHYAAHGWTAHRVYPGIPELLRQLGDGGAQLAIVTSKVERYARQIVQAAHWGQHFRAVYGVSAASAHSEKTAQIALALRDFAVPANAAVMVGDRHYDIAGARANGVRALGVLWGYGTHAELAQAGADALVESPAALAQWVLLGVAPTLREDSRA